jgi:hypothetical protein
MSKFHLALLALLLTYGVACALTPNQAVRAALADADTLAHEDQPFIRYTYLPIPQVKANYDSFVTAQKLSFNLNSTQQQFAFGLEIAPGVWRLDLRDYGWSTKQGVNWENFASIDPYFHRKETVTREETVYEDYYEYWPGGYWSDGCYYYANSFQVKKQRQRAVRKRVSQRFLYVPQGAAQLDGLASLLDSNAPIVRADWALAQMARSLSPNDQITGAGYYDFLGLKTLDDYLRLIGQGKTKGNVIRAVVTKSGVTRDNRAVLREGAEFGGHWTTFEVTDQSAAGIAIQELREGELNFVASEHYGVSPCGLPVTFLNNNKNERQDFVPANIAGDKSPLNVSNDPEVHVNLACYRCHAGNVLQPINCAVRATYTGRLETLTNSKSVALELKRQYGADLDRALAQDRLAFQNAITLCTGKTAQESAEIYSGAFSKYLYDDVTFEGIANEIGVDGPQLQTALQNAAIRLGKSRFRTDPWIAPHPGTVPRLTVEDAYQDTQDAVYGILKEDVR